MILLSIPLLYIVCEGKNIDTGGVFVRGEQGERAKKHRWAWLIEHCFYVIKYLIITVICQTNLMK